MTLHLVPVLLQALTSGAISVQYGRIAGRCGYVDHATRTVVLNPDAAPEQLAAELEHDLAALADAPSSDNRAVGEPARLTLAHSVDEAEAPGPCPTLDASTVPRLRVAE